MDLLHRPTEIADLEFCLPLLCEDFAYSPGEHAALLNFWRYLLREQRCESAVVEDRDAPPGKRIVGFGMSVFVQDTFFDSAGTSLPPFLAKSLLMLGTGYENVILTQTQIRRPNSERRLNAIILHSGWLKPEQVGEAVSAIRRTLLEALLEHHRGYGIQRILLESYGEEDFAQMLAIGWRLMNDYPVWATEHTSGQKPYLLSLRREDVEHNAYNLLYDVFHSSPPRFFFPASQQALLQRALHGKSDATCAEEMDITVDTVQKRWRSIYARVHDAAPDLISPPGELKRGSEKRTALLRYLQAHPEELRPGMPQAQPGTLLPKPGKVLRV